MPFPNPNHMGELELFLESEFLEEVLELIRSPGCESLTLLIIAKSFIPSDSIS